MRGCHAGCFRSDRFRTPSLRHILRATEVMRSAGCGQHASATPQAGTPAWRAASQALAPLPPRRRRLVQTSISARGAGGPRLARLPSSRPPSPHFCSPETTSARFARNVLERRKRPRFSSVATHLQRPQFAICNLPCAIPSRGTAETRTLALTETPTGPDSKVFPSLTPLHFAAARTAPEGGSSVAFRSARGKHSRQATGFKPGRESDQFSSGSTEQQQRGACAELVALTLRNPVSQAHDENRT